MLRTQLLAAAAIGAALAAGTAPAQAQSGSLNEMRREQSNPGQSWVPSQNRAAAEADAIGRQDAGRWLAQADQALRRGRSGQAMELLERAETRLLSRSIPVTMSGQPMQGPVLDNIASARRAIGAHDRSGAMQSIAAAQAALGSMPRDDMASGAGGGIAPSQGGGSWSGSPSPYNGSQYQGSPYQGSAPYQSSQYQGSAPYQGSQYQGGMMMHDRGVAGSSMSRADIYGPAPGGRGPSGGQYAQGAGGGAGGGGSGAEQSGGLQGSTPGSPGTGTLGSTPQSTLGLSQQPAQGAAVPLVPNQGGRAAPVPGTGVQAPGGTGQMPGDNPRGAPMTGIR